MHGEVSFVDRVAAFERVNNIVNSSNPSTQTLIPILIITISHE